MNTLSKKEIELGNTLHYDTMILTFHLSLSTIPNNLNEFINEALSLCPDLFEAQPLDLRIEYDTETEQGQLILEK